MKIGELPIQERHAIYAFYADLERSQEREILRCYRDSKQAEHFKSVCNMCHTGDNPCSARGKGIRLSCGGHSNPVYKNIDMDKWEFNNDSRVTSYGNDLAAISRYGKPESHFSPKITP